MSVTRYRDVRDMPPPPAGPDLLVRIREVFTRAIVLAPPGYTRGVQRFATLEEAQQARDRVVTERMRARRR